MREFIASMRTLAWRTAGARYNAARRLKQREWFSTFSLASLSALSIAVAFAQKVYSPTPGTPLDNYLSSVAVALGVFLLAISLLEWGGRYGAKAEALHRNAEKLTAFQLKLAQVLAQLDAGGRIADDQVTDLRMEYDAIKSSCAENHSPGDDALFRARHRLAPELAPTGPSRPAMNDIEAVLVVVRWHASALWFFVLVWATVLGALTYAWCIPKP